LPIITASVRRLPHLGASELQILQRAVALAGVDDRLKVSSLVVTRRASDEQAGPISA